MDVPRCAERVHFMDAQAGSPSARQTALEIVDGFLAASVAEVDPRVEQLYRQIAQLKASDRSVALLILDGLRQGNRGDRRHQ
jgi:hypothetical protein